MKDRRIRILYVHNSADIYGASRSLMRLLSKLDRHRFDPVVWLAEPGPLEQRLHGHASAVIINPRLSIMTRSALRPSRLLPFLLRFPVSVMALRRYIRRESIDLVHTNTGVILAPALAAWSAGVPHVWHIRDWFQEFRSLWHFHAAYMSAFSQRILAVSNAIAGQFPRREKVEVLHNGFSLEEFALPKRETAAKFRARWELGDKFVVGCVGRIKLVRKGQEVLMQAAAILKRKGREARYVIVGSTHPENREHLDALRLLIRKLDLETSVVLTGEVADTRAVYPAFDVLVLPSGQPEPFGGVVMEAMATGIPVIATAIGGSIDQVEEGVTGLLVPPSDPAALASAIERLMDSPELVRLMQNAGPRRIQEHFALDKMVRRVEKIYETLVADNTGAPPLSC